jgi:predicted DNA-binding transcriptional regulator AlpA
VSTTVVDVPPHLIGIVEMARQLGVSRQYVDRLSREDPTFPAPELELASGRVWLREAFEAWAKETGREIVGEG